jgi:AP-1 complex subunit gamma-1
VLSKCIYALRNPAYCGLFVDVIYRGALVERMPVLDEATYSAKHEMGVDGHHTTAAVASEPHANGHVKQPNGIGKQSAATGDLVDLLNFMDDQPSNPSQSTGDALLDLLGDGPIGGSNSSVSSGTLLHPFIA